MKPHKKQVTPKGFSLVEVTTITALILTLSAISITIFHIYVQAKEASTSSALLREVYTAQLRYVSMNPTTPIQPDLITARSKVYWEVVPPTKLRTFSDAEKSAILTENYTYFIEGQECSIYIPLDLRTPPFFARKGTHLTTSPTRVDPSEKTNDGKYDVGTLSPN